MPSTSVSAQEADLKAMLPDCLLGDYVCWPVMVLDDKVLRIVDFGHRPSYSVALHGVPFGWNEYLDHNQGLDTEPSVGLLAQRFLAAGQVPDCQPDPWFI